MSLNPPSQTDGLPDSLSDAQAEAVRWLTRLEDPSLSAEAFAGLCAWLEASPDNQKAFDEAERVTQLAAAAFVSLEDEALQPHPALLAAGARARFFTPLRLAAGGLALCGLIAAFVGLRPQAVETLSLVTKKGERQEITLSEGTKLYLNSDTHLNVALSKHARKLELKSGEVFVDVAARPNAPLSLQVGDQTVTDIGTQFNVRRLNSQIRVSVRQGLVDVTTDTDAAGMPAKLRLRPGDESLHREGSNAVRLVRVDPKTVLAWREGRAVYRDAPLSDVVADLNRYVTTPIVVDDAVEDLRLSAILVLDEEDRIVARLTAFLPVEAVRNDGEIRLVPARPSGRRAPAEGTADKPGTAGQS